MDDIIHAKVATVEKCLIRIQEESKADWKANFTHQEFSQSVINLDL